MHSGKSMKKVEWPIAILGLILLTPFFAAGVSVEKDGRTYHVAIADLSTECILEELGDTGVIEASCAAGDFYVTATAEWGCGDSFGPTYCGSKDPGKRPITGNELWCETRGSYVLVAGDGEARCKQENGFKHCESLDGAHVAEASCETGCGDVRGNSVCCVAGSDHCPPSLLDRSSGAGSASN
jgi:hypothetical protein